MTKEEILNLPVDVIGDNPGIKTIKDYFHALLLNLWVKGQNFDSKRPWKNGGWKYEVYAVLIQHKLISGSLDEEGFVESMDEDEADRFITRELITPLFNV